MPETSEQLWADREDAYQREHCRRGADRREHGRGQLGLVTPGAPLEPRGDDRDGGRAETHHDGTRGKVELPPEL